MSRVILLPVRFPKTTLVLLAAITFWLGRHAMQIEFDASIESLLPHFPDRVYYENVKETFGSDEAAIVAVFAEDVFAPTTLGKIDHISNELAGIEGVREILSLTTVQGVETDEFGAIQVGRLMKRVPSTDAEAQKLKAAILKNPLYAAHLVSQGDKVTGILVLFENFDDQEYVHRDIDGQIRKILAAAGGPEEYALSGIHTLKVAAARLMREDLDRFLPASVFAVMLILAWAFRTVRGVVLPMIAVLIGVVWTMGLMQLLGARINLGTLVLPPLLVALGMAYVIHILTRFYRRLGHGVGGIEALHAAVSETAVPVALAGLTTSVGFAALSLSAIQALHEFGLFALIGLVAIIVVVDVFVPAAMVLLPEPKRGRERYQHGHWVTRFLAYAGRIAVVHRWALFAATALLCAFALYGATQLRVETDYLTFIDPDHAVRQESRRVSESLGGAQPLYFVIDGNGPQSITALSTLAAMRDLQGFINEQPGVDKSLSLIDYLSVIRGALNPDAAPGLPESRQEVSQLLVFVGPKELKPVATPDFSRANILVGTQLMNSADLGELVERVEEYAARRFPPDFHVHASGTVALLNRSADTLAHGQVVGLGSVLATLLVVMSVYLVSLRGGLAALVPNVIPVILMFGIMGWFGITLSISTSIVAIIAVGLAVSDAIHYLAAFNSHLRESNDEEAAIFHVAREVGLPIVVTTMVLTAGYSVACLSNFTPIRHFGLLASVTTVGALFADLFLLPALVRSAHLVTAWEILSTTLGATPNREISLFDGLRTFQAKIVVLMGNVVRGGPGTYITREGEMKDELYVLLKGVADVRRAGSEGVIRRLQRGDVIGEMGVIREQRRSADVIATTGVEYLVLTAASLRRLQRRHPRIAALVFRNLTRILSDRLELTTNELVDATQD